MQRTHTHHKSFAMVALPRLLSFILALHYPFIAEMSIASAADQAPTRSDIAKAFMNSGEYVAIKVFPEQVEIPYLTDDQRFVVHALLADGSTRDVTHEILITGMDDGIASVRNGLIHPLQSGKTSFTLTYGGLSTSMEVEVMEGVADRPVSFRNDVIAVLTRAGCNTGKCHGAASGKDGFRLSLFGYDPAGDHFRLTREIPGRRIQLADPQNCLLINKATGDVPHTGGGLIPRESQGYSTIMRWLAEGAKADPPGTPTPVGIEVFPPKAVMSKPGESQTLAVFARYDDGTVRDVTELSVFLSNNDASATVTENGLVEGTGPGTAFILARFDEFTAGSFMIVRPGRTYAAPDFKPANDIDEMIRDRWVDLHLQPSELCSDETFIRRVYLDTVGTLPTPEETQRFLEDPSEDKRSKIIDDLVGREAFLDMWTLRLAELLLIRRANGLSEKALMGYDAWLRERVKGGVTVDQIVRQLIPATGSTFENPPTSYFQTETTPQLIAENIAQSFLGMRLQCAQCHNHPFDRWTMDDYYGFAAFVSQVGYKQGKDPREITIYDTGEGTLQHPVPGREIRPKFLGGDYPQLPPGTDYRVILADWITSKENTAFSENLANVIWEQLMGIGIITPVDDVRVSNPPSNPDLLKLLGEKLVAYDYDVRPLAREILNSKVYQLTTKANDWNRWDNRDFSHAHVRRVRAEVLLDCINQVTETSDTYSGLPLGGRAIEIPDGRSNNYFLETFGRSDRSTACSCEVSTAPTLSQALHLLNGETTSGKIEQGGLVDRLLEHGSEPIEVAEALYLRCFCRMPTEVEREKITTTLASASDVRQELVDLFWALLNSNEFVFNH